MTTRYLIEGRRRTPRFARLAALAAIAVLTAGAGPVGWGGDINDGAGPKLVEAVRPKLRAIVEAAPDARAALVTAFVKEDGLKSIEAVKRFRNPELLPLFLALLDHEDWKVRHRALYVLEYLRPGETLARAWPLLSHQVPRLREKAAITCIKVWNAKRAKSAAGGDPVAAIRALAAAEKDSHVRSCLAALERRATGKLPFQKVHEEYVRKDEDGLHWTPFISGLNNVGRIAPGYKKKGVSKGGGSSATKLGPAPRWTTPLLGFGEEEVKGTSLQPFANLRGNGTVYHTGQDVGSCMDGAGYYAAAAGVVKLIHAGSDMGTLLVVQHCTGKKTTINAVYMHGGDTVFVKGGEKVVAGQLLGTMGMSYSIENGGHYSHLHYGLYPGTYSDTHNYGYRNVASGLADWRDPAVFLPRWVARTAPLVTPPADVPDAFTAALSSLEDGHIGKAHANVSAVLQTADLKQSVNDQGIALREAIEKAVPAALSRAKSERDLGYPAWALDYLSAAGKRLKGVPGSADLAAEAKAWQADAAFKKALKGDAKLAKAEMDAVGLVAKKGGKDKIAKLWNGLLADYGDTVLRPRIEAAMKLAGVK